MDVLGKLNRAMSGDGLDACGARVFAVPGRPRPERMFGAVLRGIRREHHAGPRNGVDRTHPDIVVRVALIRILWLGQKRRAFSEFG